MSCDKPCASLANHVPHHPLAQKTVRILPLTDVDVTITGTDPSGTVWTLTTSLAERAGREGLSVVEVQVLGDALKPGVQVEPPIEHSLVLVGRMKAQEDGTVYKVVRETPR